jgi:hypothetical protein
VAEDFEQAGDDLAARLAADEHLSIVAGQGVNGSHGLKTRYVGYPRGSKRVIATYPLGDKVSEATLQYDVKFDHDFQFVTGGKLHGLAPKDRITGGSPMKPHGWSARIMFQERGKLGSYIYCQDKDSKYGQGRGARGFTFEKGRYYAISFHIKLNAPADRDNGFARIYVNGQKLVDHRNIQYRAAEGKRTRIQKLLFSTFHGGHSPEDAPRDDQGEYTTVHAYFDNFSVYPGRKIRARPGG